MKTGIDCDVFVNLASCDKATVREIAGAILFYNVVYQRLF